MNVRSPALLLALALSACGEPLNPEDIPDIDGTWTFVESITVESSACSTYGTIAIAQEGETFIGAFNRTSQCVAQGIQTTSASTETGQITRGTVGRETMEFAIGNCDYRGVLDEPPLPDRATGSVFCTAFRLDGSVFVNTGTWRADRIPD